MCLNPRIAYPRKVYSHELKKQYEGDMSVFGDEPHILHAKMKKYITFNPKYGWVDKAFKIPCGKCAECRAKKRSDWSNRILMESSMHEKCSFVTLTYAPDFLPRNEINKPTLVKKHLQLFLKRLRKELSKKDILIRYYAVGEYGKKKGRPHYHLVIFGYDFPDKKYFKKRGNFIDYVDEILAKTWTCGYHTVNEWSDRFANYISGYITKKLNDDKLDYKFRNIEEPFHLMSRRRGLGYGFFLMNYKQIFGNLKLVIRKNLKFVQIAIPRQFWNWCKELSDVIAYRSKKRFVEIGEKFASLREELSVSEKIHIEKVKTWFEQRGERSFENGDFGEVESYFAENWQWRLRPLLC